MKQHTWTTKEVDGGHLGISDFWCCSVCGAGSGSVWPGQVMPKGYIFLPNGSGLALTEDCEESQKLIDAFNLGMECANRWKKE